MNTNVILRFFAANLALGIAWFGYFLPWIAPVPVALQLSAHDLVEWMTFVQTVRDGTFPISRLDLSLPLAGLALLASLTPSLVYDQPSTRPQVSNLIYLLLGLFSAFLILPVYPFVLTAYSDPELSPQFWLGIVTGLIVVPLAVFAFLRPAWARWLVPVIALAAISFAVRAYTLAEPALTDILTKPVPLGIGYILFLLGCGLLLLLPLVPRLLKVFPQTK